MTKLAQETTSQLLLKIALATALFLCFQGIARAQSIEQNELSKNSVYLDTGIGFGGQVSFNYERQIYSGEKVTWFGRLGAGAAYKWTSNDDVSLGPGGLAALTMLTGKGNNHFELNAGTFIVSDSDKNNSGVYPLLDAGYRYQKPGGGFIFKTKIGILGLGIGLGYAF
ncbi:MAG: hypothetical protein KAJ23_05495 [Maribacter sp.]|nr:hypothetical protein [Maribacter sp.]